MIVILQRSKSSGFPLLFISIITFSVFNYSAENPQPKLRDKSFPVPKGRIATGGLVLLH